MVKLISFLLKMLCFIVCVLLLVLQQVTVSLLVWKPFDFYESINSMYEAIFDKEL